MLPPSFAGMRAHKLVQGEAEADEMPTGADWHCGREIGLLIVVELAFSRLN